MEGIPGDYQRKAFHSGNGELAWNREDVREVIALLRDQGFAILGGEVWFVRTGERLYSGLVPQRGSDRPGVYSWTGEREPGEAWDTFVGRSASQSLDAVERMPAPDDLPHDLPGTILYNLTWVDEAELAQLETDRARVFAAGSRSGREESRPGFLARLFGRRR